MRNLNFSGIALVEEFILREGGGVVGDAYGRGYLWMTWNRGICYVAVMGYRYGSVFAAVAPVSRKFQRCFNLTTAIRIERVCYYLFC